MTIDKPAASHLPVLRSLWKQAFGDPDEFLDSFFSVAFSENRCRCLYMDGRLAASLYWFDADFENQKIAYLYAVATDKTYQNRGLCRALMEDTHRHLYALGYDAAMLVPGSEGLFRLYEKLGYRTAAYIREFTCTAVQVPADLRPIDAAQYVLLRKKYLPAGGVIQEGAAVALLQTQADFYAGSGCILIAAREAGALRILELLGDISAAPAVTAALGADTAVFRTPGEDKPFAMYRSLTEREGRLPAYFGLALD